MSLYLPAIAIFSTDESFLFIDLIKSVNKSEQTYSFNVTFIK